MREKQDAQAPAHLAALRDIEVDLTAYVTQARVPPLRGPAGATQAQIDSSRKSSEKAT